MNRLIIQLSIATCFAVGETLLASQAAPGRAAPLSSRDIIQMLGRRTPSTVIERVVSDRGVDFDITREIEATLKTNGATDKLIELLRRLNTDVTRNKPDSPPKGGGRTPVAPTSDSRATKGPEPKAVQPPPASRIATAKYANWSIDNVASSLFANQDFGDALWISANARNGWALGTGPDDVLRLTNGAWVKDSAASSVLRTVIAYSPKVAMNAAGDAGWAIKRDAFRYLDGRWLQDVALSSLIMYSLQGIWVSERGDLAFAFEENGGIWRYSAGKWASAGDFPFSDTGYHPVPKSIWLDALGEQGWAVGDDGTNGRIFMFKGGRWSVQDTLIRKRYLSSLWLDRAGSIGWAVGDSVVLRYQSGRWQQFQEELFTRNTFCCVRFDKTGTRGWAVGTTVLKYEDGRWRVDDQAKSIVGNQNLRSLWLNEDGDEGWAIGSRGTVYRIH